MLRILDIVPGTSVDGPGLRTAIYFAGCSHNCPGCHNPSSHDFAGGREMTIEDIVSVIEDNGFNVTYSGGDPLQQDPELLTELSRRLTECGYNLWCYTGYNYEHVICHPALKYIDVLVDGPFIEEQRDPSLIFKGSVNQRLIDLKMSTRDDIVEWKSDF